MTPNVRWAFDVVDRLAPMKVAIGSGIEPEVMCPDKVSIPSLNTLPFAQP